MIYGKQYHPMKSAPPPSPQETPPTLQKLNLLLQMGDEAHYTVNALVEKFRLPYRIGNDKVTGQFMMIPTLSKGEMFIQKFLTQDEETLQMLSDARLMSAAPYDVLITGETGTGKELLANAMIGDKEGYIKIVNCAGLPEHLIESELFGHEKGAFTGAYKDKEGMLSEAKGGVMFLDEISELPIHLQSKLLRVLQEKTIRKVGSNVEEPITCKFVCATNRSLKDMVEKGLFKKDLFARISTLELSIKPLRDRPDDIPLICSSLPGGEKFLRDNANSIPLLKLDFNVRSLIQYVTRYNVLGRLVI